MSIDRILTVWVVLTALVLQAAATELLSAEAFTKTCAAKVQASVPRSRVEVTEPLQLRLRHPDTGQSTIYLKEGYETYKLAPDKLDEVVQKYVAGVLEAAPDSLIDASRIVPVVKPRSWLDQIGSGKDGAAPVVYDELNEELILVYAEDAPQSLSYFSPVDFTRTKIDRQGLRKLAAENLVRLLPEIERRGADGVYMISAGGDLEPSFLAIGGAWSRESFDVKGDFVFGVPSRGVLYITGSDDREGVKKIRDLTRTRYRDDTHKISPKLFVLRGGQLAVLPE